MQELIEHLSPSAVENINIWLNEPKYAQYKAELESQIQAGDWQQLEDAFFKVIEFGTGGRRGTTGIGSNRINRVTIGESAQALCEYLSSIDSGSTKKGIVIGFDTRLSSPELSRVAAEVVAACGFETYIFDSFRATPELSFAVRYLGCAAGIVISASHNPPADNGFKAYWSDGGQLVSPYDKGVMDMVSKVTEIKSVNYDDAVADGRITIIGDDVDKAYITATTAMSLGTDRNVSIVYSPLHGTGQVSVLPTLQAAGFNNISLVEAQMVPDGTFPAISTHKPNPEEKAANEMAIAQMMSESADIAITNDPDADRIAVFVRQGDKSISLTGNQIAVLAADYVLNKLKTRGELTADNYIVETIVTTDMLKALADYYEVKCYSNLLIGFKYIGELILKKEKTSEKFVIGGEESLGLLMGTYARDKDGATGALPISEFAAELKTAGKTLYGRLLELFEKYGVYVESLNNMMCPGSDGFAKMKHIMDSLRQSPPKSIGNYTVTAVLDYALLERQDLATGDITPIDCVAGNVFVLEFGDPRRRITIRPSGTEPKLKFYIQWFENADGSVSVEEQYNAIYTQLDDVSNTLEKLLIEL